MRVVEASLSCLSASTADLAFHTPAGSADFCSVHLEAGDHSSREEAHNIHRFIMSYSKTGTSGSCMGFFAPYLRIPLRVICFFPSSFCAPLPVSRPPLGLHPSHTDTLISAE